MRFCYFFTSVPIPRPFNIRCEIAKRGKNKQGRNNLRQISYALFCTEDGDIPLFYDPSPNTIFLSVADPKIRKESYHLLIDLALNFKYEAIFNVINLRAYA